MIDPVENNLFDLPDYEHTHDETFQPLLPPDSPGGAAEGALLNGDPEGNQLTQNKDSSVTTRRAVKRTIPKLDAQRLSSERGLPALCNLFDSVNFKGKGHEKVAMADHITLGHCNRRKYESVAKHLNFDHVTMGDAAPVEADLKTLIRHMEHWAHRLFPQLQFEKVVERIESLGNKKPVQACLKRIRLDLPLSNEDFRSHEGEDENNRHSPAPEGPVFLPETQNSPKESGSPSLSPALTEEQQQRIERNRQRALERRQAKNQLSQSPNDDLPASEEYGTIAAQEKDEVCIDKAGVPFQPTEDMRSSTDQVSF